ncbi:Acid trehalase protein 1 [Fasciolopsis buskii]|uniref:Acid trehalase protein 1 n=1 Tax=Fasciolopsis buskii TaxID=27845 RepID=A0A8E0RNV5_9TREM|nr:Acid trehalase protein 1 [Fasciolopsis buski]
MEYPKRWSCYSRYFDDILGPPENYTCRSLFCPVPLSLKPYLGNGFIATQPDSPWIFLDGLYNGDTTESHRACIPSPICWSAKVHLDPDAPLSDTPMHEADWMHFGMGVHSRRVFHRGVHVEMSTFVSRSRPGVLIRFVEAFFPECASTDQILVTPDSAVEFYSPDCEIVTTRISDGTAIIGSTRIVESEHFQPETSRFYIFTNVIPDTLSNGFTLTPNDPYRIFLTCISRKSMSHAMEQYTSECRLCWQRSLHFLVEEQAATWSQLWHDGGILLGITSRLFVGHVFWDMEMWMLPWVNLFHTNQCRLALDYRYFMVPAARYLALLENHEGARYPWESAFTGNFF